MCRHFTDDNHGYHGNHKIRYRFNCFEQQKHAIFLSKFFVILMKHERGQDNLKKKVLFVYTGPFI